MRSCIDNFRDKLIVQMLYATGMRVGEFTKLKVEDIDLQNGLSGSLPRTAKQGLPGVSGFPRSFSMRSGLT